MWALENFCRYTLETRDTIWMSRWEIRVGATVRPKKKRNSVDLTNYLQRNSNYRGSLKAENVK